MKEFGAAAVLFVASTQVYAQAYVPQEVRLRPVNDTVEEVFKSARTTSYALDMMQLKKDKGLPEPQYAQFKMISSPREATFLMKPEDQKKYNTPAKLELFFDSKEGEYLKTEFEHKKDAAKEIDSAVADGKKHFYRGAVESDFSNIDMSTKTMSVLVNMLVKPTADSKKLSVLKSNIHPNSGADPSVKWFKSKFKIVVDDLAKFVDFEGKHLDIEVAYKPTDSGYYLPGNYMSQVLNNFAGVFGHAYSFANEIYFKVKLPDGKSYYWEFR